MNQSIGRTKQVSPLIRQISAGHRRIGLASLALMILGGGWISASVLPGLQMSNLADKDGAKFASASGGISALLSRFLGKAVSAPTESKVVTYAPSRSDSTEAVFEDAPIELALQMLLASSQYNASYDSNISGLVSFSNRGAALPIWKVIGRVIGAAPTPGVQIIHRWDTFYIMPRDKNPFGDPSSQVSHPTPSPTPVPISEGHVTHRMAGYVVTHFPGGLPPFRMALMETRIPGEPPRWRMVHEGESFPRHSRETGSQFDPSPGNDNSPIVDSIASDHLVLHGSDNKRLIVPLAKQGAVDIFGFSAAPANTAASPATATVGGSPNAAGSILIGGTSPAAPAGLDDHDVTTKDLNRN